MSVRIYYFSGTGNSLAVAREVTKDLNVETSLCSIGKLINEESIQVDTDVIGFVFPVYFMDIPDVLKCFIEKLNFKVKPYIFAIATCNGAPGESLIKLNKYLINKGQELSYGFVVPMPGNAIVTRAEVIDERLNNYKAVVSEITNNINNRSTNEFEGEYNFKSHIVSHLLKTIGKKIYLNPKNAHCTSQCIGCGTCARVCPMNNIKIVNNRPQWGNNCSNCLACFHWCPKQAVKGGIMLNKRASYHNPEVSIKDMHI